MSVRNAARGFTLVELLVSMTVLSILTVFLLSVTTHTGNIWRTTSGKLEQFSRARDAFESLTRRISQATLNTYWDYDDPNNPTKYLRKSELRFKSGPGADGTHEVFFQAPFGYSDSSSYSGLENLLNTWGYYIAFAKDPKRPTFVSGEEHPRYRLMEYMEPSESMAVYKTPASWFPAALADRKNHSHVLAENVIGLILLPKLSPEEDSTGAQLAPQYAYDSTTDGPNGSNKNFNTKNQLPPIVETVLVAIDEASAQHAANGDSAPDMGLSGLFEDSDLASRQTDLVTLQNNLKSLQVNYRIFTSDIAIRGAKWSRD